MGRAAHMDERRARRHNWQRDDIREKEQQQQQQQKQVIVPRRRHALIPQASIDEALAPSLAHEALNVQTKEAFQQFLVHYFPIMNASVAPRVDVNWMDFVRSPQPLPPAVMWGVRALVTYQMGAVQAGGTGKQHEKENARLTARHMYIRGIRHLASVLGTSSALADSTLAAAIVLCMFEVVDGACDGSWLLHSQGIRSIMAARGPAAHKTGMGRNLLLSYRPFLIGEAFTRCEPCILGRPEWAAIFDDVDISPAEGESETKTKTTSSSPLGQTIDYAFNESAKCPGYYAATHEIITSYPAFHKSKAVAQSLMDDMGRTRCSLLRLQDSLDQGLYFCQNGTDLQLSASFAGSIPPAHVASLAKLSSEGIGAAVALLDQLGTLLRSHLHRVLPQYQSGWKKDFHQANPEDPWYAATNRLGTAAGVGARLESDACRMGNELDRFSVSMGMLNIY
ncbi:uncharacterized protein APUU_80867S [Aspergillus puulaauensis]|uniref:C6 finger domain protein n=1 Tax=Aspergillus puulaauensis TaxID=1220207 RepID=A0A7R8ASN4_9EURO|nr:uncharacterized protein APUU_80867S [Aspergillus puulaauensis]BCS30564.1 hypothetical protein APUU_80867S [Aspergillus puulaauensis]